LNLDYIKEDADIETLWKSGFNYISKQMEDVYNNKAQIMMEYTSLLQGYGVAIESVFSAMERYKKKSHTAMK